MLSKKARDNQHDLGQGTWVMDQVLLFPDPCPLPLNFYLGNYKI